MKVGKQLISTKSTFVELASKYRGSRTHSGYLRNLSKLRTAFIRQRNKTLFVCGNYKISNQNKYYIYDF